MRHLCTLLLALALLAPAAATAQQGAITEPPTAAAAAMCAKFADADAVTKDACYRSCAEWPIKPQCSMLRRFGYDGWAAGGLLLQEMQRGVMPDWKTLNAKHPYLREVLELHVFPPGADPPWRTEAQRALIKQGIEALQRFQRFDAAGEYTSAIEAAQDAEKAISSALGPNHPITAVATNNHALALWHAGRYPDAAKIYQRALAAATASLGPEDPFLATLLDNLGTIREAMGDYPGSIADIERALAINLLTAGPQNPQRAIILNNMATTLHRMGDDQAARASALDALALSEQVRGVPPDVLGHILGNLASIHAALGELGAARAYYERDLRHTEAALGPKHPDTAQNLANLATLLYALGDLEQARAHLERALEIYETTLGPKHPRYAEALSNLASVLDAQGDHAGAAREATRALQLREEALGKDHPDLANSLNNLAGMLASSGQRALATQAYQRAIQIETRALGAKHPRLATPMHNLGVNQVIMGQHEQGLATMRRALALREAALGKDSPELAPQLETIALVEAHLKRGDPWAAMARAAKLRSAGFWSAADAADSDLQLLSSSALDDASTSAFLAIAWREGKDDALWAELLERTGRATRAEQLRRSWRHLMERRPKRADDAWRKLEAARRALQLERARAQRTEQPADTLIAATRAVALAEQALDKRWPDYAKRRADHATSAEATCAVLRAEHAAMIHWLRAAPDLLAPADAQPVWRALIVTPAATGCAIHRVDLGPAAPIDAAITAWRAQLAEVEQRLSQRKPPQLAQQKLHEAGQALHALIWAPLVPALGATTRLYLVPQDRLLEVALGALPEADGGALARRLDMVYLPVPALLANPVPAATGAGALVLGALDFNATPDAAAASRWQRCQADCKTSPAIALQLAQVSQTRSAEGRACGWRKLSWPRVGAEALEVARTLGQRWRGQDIWLITGSGAAQEAVQRAMPGKRLLHFGTHGFFAPADGCQGVTHQRAGLLADAPPRAGLDPMQLSALVLSGANVVAADADDAHDGALTAREIVGLDLSSVEIATLAACETGRGEAVAGEGAQGLGKAFLVAGVREVIVSLWQVPERETTQLMRDLYAALPPTRAPGQAARALLTAQRTLAAQQDAAGQPHNVFTWAAFIPVTAGPAFGAP
jgi:tetratricopeptide (TPR) repeat protein